MNSRLGLDLLPDLTAIPGAPGIVVQLHVGEADRSGYVRAARPRRPFPGPRPRRGDLEGARVSEFELRGSHKIARRPERATRPATCSRRWRIRLGSARESSPSRQSERDQQSSSPARSESSSQAWLWQKAAKGRLRMPVSLAQRIASSQRARRWWRSSKAAMSAVVLVGDEGGVAVAVGVEDAELGHRGGDARDARSTVFPRAWRRGREGRSARRPRRPRDRSRRLRSRSAMPPRVRRGSLRAPARRRRSRPRSRCRDHPPLPIRLPRDRPGLLHRLAR